MRFGKYVAFLAALALPLMAGNVHIVPPERDENSVDGDQSYYTGGDYVLFCGRLVDDAAPNNEETFIRPVQLTYIGVYSQVSIGTAATCDTYDDEQESAVEQALLSKGPAYKVSGFFCIINTDPGSDVTFTFRNEQADTTPVLSCTIPGNGTSKSCATSEATTTDIPVQGKIAMKVTMAENLDAFDAWCRAHIATKALTST
jgi:hypothetical protein